jgi:hypothetical protein
MSEQDHNAHAAAIYRALVLRFYLRYVDMRHDAEFQGGDLDDHGHLPTQADADGRYEAAVNECIWESPASTDAALALVKFAGILAADRLIGEITSDPVNDQRDAYHQSVALAHVSSWLNNIATDEFLERDKQHREGGGGSKPKPTHLKLLH